MLLHHHQSSYFYTQVSLLMSHAWTIFIEFIITIMYSIVLVLTIMVLVIGINLDEKSSCAQTKYFFTIIVLLILSKIVANKNQGPLRDSTTNFA
jgi:hypothetical protein